MAASRVPTLRTVRTPAQAGRVDLTLLPVGEGALAAGARSLGRAVAAVIERRARDGDFRGRVDDFLLLQTERGTFALVGLGSGRSAPDVWLRAGARFRREAERLSAKRVAVHLGSHGEHRDAVANLTLGFLLAGYSFDRYRSEHRPRRTESLVLVSETLPQPATLRHLLEDAWTVAGGVFGVRDLVNEPPSVATPRFLAECAHRLAEGSPSLEVEIWKPERMVQEGLTGCLAVARGSAEEPRFIILRHSVEYPRRRIALVGKGITFDSGGLSLKPAKSMETMKSDMAGGATALHAVSVAATLGLPVEVTAYVPATENLPGGRAQKPGDVIRYANGKTVEVLNTDAEGRLVLADALLLAVRARPDVVIDLATLTGAARIALGNLYACVLGNDQTLIDELLAASRASGEGLWQLPLVREYREDLKSGIADLRNVGGGDAGTILGALFLGEFVDGVPWAHLDIAGAAFADKELPLAPRGATGYGLRLLVEYLRSVAS
jgi:leucyl aminopeptidase